MRKLLMTITTVGLVFGPAAALAIRLDNIVVNSALNQPLRAEIAIKDRRGMSPNEMQVSLASVRAFADVEMPRPANLLTLKFVIETHQDGEAFIVISTQDDVHDPYLQFLLDFNWSGNHLLRQYTILLDPLERLNKQNRLTATTVHHYGPTRASDTLWHIADTNRRSGMSTEQAVSEIFANNPDAFLEGDKNLLKQGVYLKIPGREIVTVNRPLRNDAVQNDTKNSAPVSVRSEIPSMWVKSTLPAPLKLAPPHHSDSSIASVVYQDKNASATTSAALLSADLDAEKERNQQLQKQLALLESVNRKLKQSILEKDALVLEAENIAQTKVTGKAIQVEKPIAIAAPQSTMTNDSVNHNHQAKPSKLGFWLIGCLLLVGGGAYSLLRWRHLLPKLKPILQASPIHFGRKIETPIVEPVVVGSVEVTPKSTEASMDVSPKKSNPEKLNPEMPPEPEFELPTPHNTIVAENDHVLEFTPAEKETNDLHVLDMPTPLQTPYEKLENEIDYQGFFDLAQAYIEIADYEGARQLLTDITEKADDALKMKARALLVDIAGK